jgi:SAM-dependent methyltransferase
MSSESTLNVPDYGYRESGAGWAHAYLWRPLCEVLKREAPPPRRIFEIGSGNGATAHMLSRLGYDVTGIDASESGVQVGNRAHPEVRLEVASAYDDLAARYGTFDIVLSMEVIEHLYAPRLFAKSFCDLLSPGALGIITTPYHGYSKNVALALTNRLDFHFGALWDGGHIKFWSRASLGRLLAEFGLVDVNFIRVGRIPPLAKSMIATCRKTPHVQSGGG